MNREDIEVLKLVESGDMFWSKREGGSEPYQIHRARLHQLQASGYVEEFQKSSCCHREYYLTEKGVEVLKNERR